MVGLELALDAISGAHLPRMWCGGGYADVDRVAPGGDHGGDRGGGARGC